MKNKYRRQALAHLLDQLKLTSFDSRELALFQLGLILECSNLAESTSAMPDYFVDGLSREQLRLRLSSDEQREVVDHLMRLIALSVESRPSAFWALGKIDCDTLLLPLSTFVTSIGAQLNNESAFQLCHALRRCLGRNHDSELGTVGIENGQELPGVISRWQKSSDARLCREADKLAIMLEAMNDN